MRGVFGRTGILTRLLGLMALVVLPVLIASLVFAARTYRQQLASIEETRTQIANDFAVRTRVWLRGASRALLTSYAASLAGHGDSTACSAMIEASLKANPGYRAIYLELPDGRICSASSDTAFSSADLKRISDQEVQRPTLKLLAGPQFVPSRYDALVLEGAKHLLVQLSVPSPQGRDGTALLITSGDGLNATYDIGPLDDAIVGLVQRSGDIMAMRGLPILASDWLPVAMPESSGYLRHDGLSRDGQQASFARMPIADSPLDIVVRFSDDDVRAAWGQYIVMTVTPVLITFFLFGAYVFALRRDVIRWILGIRLAARARIADSMSRELAPVHDDMPRELMSVATAFNQMVGESHAREATLAEALENNRFLMRELHHRVKNSLQVIQSYLSLSQRDAGHAKRRDLAETEVRVLVLSVAYRLALTGEGMRPVPIRAMADEVVASLASSLRRENQWISLSAEIDGLLDVDRIIPLGLAIVEGVMAALKSPDCERVTVVLRKTEEGRFELAVTATPGDRLRRPDHRIMRGLALQLQAISQPAQPGVIILWHFSA